GTIGQLAGGGRDRLDLGRIRLDRLAGRNHLDSGALRGRRRLARNHDFTRRVATVEEGPIEQRPAQERRGTDRLRALLQALLDTVEALIQLLAHVEQLLSAFLLRARAGLRTRAAVWQLLLRRAGGPRAAPRGGAPRV